MKRTALLFLAIGFAFAINAQHHMVPATNINQNGYPRINEDLSVEFHVKAPEADLVQIDLCGKKYDLTKGVDGTWTGCTEPQVPYISCGEQAPRISHTKKYVDIMRDAGVQVVFNSFPGDHEWQVWRKSFADFVPLLYQNH